MSEAFKLVFRGEVLEGQHPAVVRKRLADSAGFDDAVLDKLFSGRPVVLKQEADTATAARWQVLFKKAGGRLRVLPVDAGEESASPEPAAAARERRPTADGGGDLDVLPPGSDLLRASERRPPRERVVDTSALSLEGARSAVPPEAPVAAPAGRGPEASGLSLAEAGSNLGPAAGAPAPVVSAPDFDVAAVGADLGQRHDPVTPAIDLSAVSFEVAPAGSRLGRLEPAATPAAPDTSHLSLQTGPADSE